MTAVPTGFTPIDPGRIESSDPVEVEYWSAELGCTVDELTEVMGRVGTHVTVVRDALARRLRDAR